MTTLPQEAGQILLPLARHAIATALGRQAPANPASPPWLQAQGASYVTLRQAAQLRGRIGTLAPRRPLGEDVVANAVAAALRDPCFSPLSLDELDLATIEVAVLSVPERIMATDEQSALACLRAGTDGVIFRYGHHHSTFLPEAWAQHADPVEFLAHLKYKAGLPPDFWDAAVELQRYTVVHWQDTEP